MDKLRRWGRDGFHHLGWRHVPALAAHPTPWRLVSLHALAGSRRVVTRHCRDTFDILHHHYPRGESRNMDISALVRRCRIRMCFILVNQPAEANQSLYSGRLLHPALGVGLSQKEVKEEVCRKIGQTQECEQWRCHTRRGCGGGR